MKANAIERRRLEAAELQLARELSVVDEVARIVTTTLDLDKVYEEFATEVKKLVDFDRMSISLWDQHAGIFTMKHTVGQEVPGQHVGDMVPNFLPSKVPLHITATALSASPQTGVRFG